MPSEFDRLVAELQIEDMMKALSPAQRDGFMKAVSETAYGVQPDQRRVLERAFEKAQAMPSLYAVHDGTDIHAGAKKSPKRSDAGTPHGRPRKKPGMKLLAKAQQQSVMSGAQLVASAGEACAAADRAALTVRSAHRQMIRNRARDVARIALAKALSAFHEGRLTGHEVATIQAMSNALDAKAALLESSQ